MKKTKYLMITYLFILVSCKTEEKRVTKRFPNGQPESIIIYPDKLDTTSCKIFIYHDNGNLKLELTIREGKYIGEKITYYHSGKIYQIDSLSQPCDTMMNECDGALIRYYENGKISQKYTIKNNAFNGMSKHFSNNGLLIKEYELKNDSIKNGVYREFYDNGKKAFECTYENNMLVGNEYYFKENGDTSKYYNHEKGIISFPYKKWLYNQVILYGNFIDSTKKSVLWIWKDNEGKEIKKRIVIPESEGFIVPE